MKHKFFTTALLFIVCFVLPALAQDDKPLPLEQLPAAIHQFVSTHFPQLQITEAQKEVQGKKVEYEIELNDDVKLEFDGRCRIKEIESDNELPASVIPQRIANYVSTHHPGRIIRQWKRDGGYQKIELDNDVKLNFDRKGNFVRKSS